MNRNPPWGPVSLATPLLALLAGCQMSTADAAFTERRAISTESFRKAQTPLDGNSIPKFVDRLPTLAGKRVDGTSTLSVNMEEFQQKVLPASVYARLAAPYNQGTY